MSNKIFTTEYINYYNENDNKGIINADESPFFRNTKGLRKSHINFKLTEEELKEYEKCKEDPIYFINTYILNRDNSNFKLRDYQEEAINLFNSNQYTALLSSRQLGKTTTTALYILWEICFKGNHTSVIFSDKNVMSMSILGIIKRFYSTLPFFLKPGVITDNKMSLKLDNNSIVSYESLKSYKLDQDIDTIFVDEASYLYKSDYKLKELCEYYTDPLNSYNPKIILVSSAGDMKTFYDIYEKAEAEENDFVPSEWHYSSISENDEKRMNNIRKSLGEDAFLKEYENVFS